MQREECKLHSAIVQLVQEREMLSSLVLRGAGFEARGINNVVSPPSNGGSYKDDGRQEYATEPMIVMTEELQLCNLSEILPEKLLESCQKTLNLSTVSCSSHNQSNFSNTDNDQIFHDSSNQYINTNVSYGNINNNGRRLTSNRNVNTGASQFRHQCNGDAKLANNTFVNSNHK